jgi:hypothetical protein
MIYKSQKHTYMYRLFIVMLLLGSSILIGNSLHAQQYITGKVIDAVTGQPVELASVIGIGNNSGTLTNSDGVFKLKLSRNILYLGISYFGFEPVNVPVNAQTLYYSIFLQPSKNITHHVPFEGLTLHQAMQLPADKIFSNVRAKKNRSMAYDDNECLISLLLNR